MERAFYLLTAAALLVFSLTGLSDGDKNQGKTAMRGFAGLFLTAAVLSRQLKLWLQGIRWLPILLQLGVAVYLLAILLLYLVGVCSKATGEERFVLVLGTVLDEDRPSPLLEGRLRAAEEFLQKHKEAAAVVSGGQVNREILPEGEVMAWWMQEHGIEEKRVRKETESRTTLENFRYSRTVLQQMGFSSEEPLAVATDRFHFLRVLWLGHLAGFGTLRLIPAKTKPRYSFCWYFREVLVFVKFLIEGPR